MCACGNSGNQFDAMDALSVLSLIIGYSNLIENRQQSAQNDVNAANDKQAKHLLNELGKRLDEQDAMLKKNLEVVTDGRNGNQERN